MWVKEFITPWRVHFTHSQQEQKKIRNENVRKGVKRAQLQNL